MSFKGCICEGETLHPVLIETGSGINAAKGKVAVWLSACTDLIVDQISKELEDSGEVTVFLDPEEAEDLAEKILYWADIAREKSCTLRP